MKKGLGIFVVLLLLIAGGAYYMLSGAGDFIRVQMEQQGSQYLDTQVSVASVDLVLTEGRMTINGVKIQNPQGFSDEDAFKVDAMTLDLGEVLKEPYVIQTVNINAPEILYEVDKNGKGNLLALKNNLAANLPKTTDEPVAKDTANPLLIVENVSVSNVRLKLNFEQLETGDLKIETKAYEVTLPTFSAGPIGNPKGMPADKVGAAVVNAMLDNVIAAAKSEAKKRLSEEAKKKVNKELEKQKDKLLDKASDKLKGLLN
ncbi:bZIP transcription factor [uncultured Paraglaciecola sp.]|uniref:bZIP transcription factor n=1 Tax=uncultured Paraglaciecola sp. TaxID=1765024 RepID=UPI0030D8C99C|tara:strand:+ start:45065 stop:45841 length:777 start_codon:yes stop_codon:yes gene_type:complete